MTALGQVTCHPYTSREEWLSMRFAFADMTASRVPCLFGCGYQTLLGAWAEMTGRIEPQADKPLFKKGRWFEAACVEAIQDEYPDLIIRRPRMYLRSATARIGCTDDVHAIDPDRPGFGVIECKDRERPDFIEQWQGGDPNGEIIPPIAIQLQTYTQRMLVEATTGEPVWAAIAALVHGYKYAALHLIKLPPNPELEQDILDHAAAFWADVDANREPEEVPWSMLDPTRDAETVSKLLPRDDGSEIDLSSDNLLPALVDQRSVLAKEISDLETQKKSIETTVKAKMGTASYALLADGRRLANKLVEVKEHLRKASSYRKLQVMKAPTNEL